MAIWIQSLSWTLIYAVGQGFIIFSALWFILKLMPASSAKAKYQLSLSALTLLLAWFVSTLWQQFELFSLQNDQRIAAAVAHQTVIGHEFPNLGSIETYLSIESFPLILQVIFPWLAAFYIVGLTLMLIRLSGGMLHLMKLRTKGITPVEYAVDELLSSLKAKLHFDGPVKLFISAKAQVPMVIGFFKPIILMPAATMAQLSTAELETILLHELAHIKRYDYVVNILQTVVETILFFNPFVWMISRVIRRERELCCDDLVLEHTADPIFYATALTTIASYSVGSSSLVVAASGQSGELFQRIQRIMEMKKNSFSYSRLIAAVVIVAGFILSVAWISPSLDKDVASDSTHSIPPPMKIPTSYLDKREAVILGLIEDKVLNPELGGIIEKKDNKLYVNKKIQPDVIASKYLPFLDGKDARIDTYHNEVKQLRDPKESTLQFLPTLFKPAIQRNYSLTTEGC